MFFDVSVQIRFDVTVEAESALLAVEIAKRLPRLSVDPAQCPCGWDFTFESEEAEITEGE